MRLSAPCNWDFELIDKIRKDTIDEVYGKLSQDVVGGGRMAFILPHISKKNVASYIRRIHQYNIKFNYLLNSTCLGNIEWSRRGNREINRLLDWLDSIDVDAVTVSIPYLLQLIKKRYPRFRVYVSTQTGVSSLREAQYWQNLGADRITLSVHKVNRDFELLKLLRRNLKCELQLIANLHCLKSCPFWLYHGTCSAHNSQATGWGNRFAIDYSFIMCSYIRLKNPVEFIRSEWIRPEDVCLYEEIGIDRIKLVNRTMPTDTIIRIVDAYTNRRYDGNLLDLFSDVSRTFVIKKPNLLLKFKYLSHPFSVNVFKLMKARKLFYPSGIHIDNRALDGFINYFLKNGGCKQRSCDECGYCAKMAEEAIKVKDRHMLTCLIAGYEDFLGELISGGVFKLFF